jgi:hypothetical protein
VQRGSIAGNLCSFVLPSYPYFLFCYQQPNDLHHQRPTQIHRISAAALLAVW